MNEGWLCVCVCREKIAVVQGGTAKRERGSLKLLSYKISVFTGANGLCHHYATTVQCSLVAALRLIVCLLDGPETWSVLNTNMV